MMNFRPTNDRARAFGTKAMKQLQDDEESSGSGLTLPGSATTFSMTYATVTRIVIWSTLTGTRN